jgi:oligopeptide transport system permease protein
MLRSVINHFLRGILILVFSTLIVFLLVHAIPGNPWSNFSTSEHMFSGFAADPVYQKELNRRFGLDLPLWRQFTRYFIGDLDENGSFFCGAVCGNLGPSLQQRGRSIQKILFVAPPGLTFWQSQVGYSVRLILFSFVLSVGLGIPLGILSSVKPRSKLSRGIAFTLAALISVPNFVLGLLAIIVLASWLKVIHVLPDWNYFGNWIIPGLVLAMMPMASIARITRASLINIMHEDFVRTAYGKGLTKSRVLLVHVMRNAIVPIITFLGPALMEIITGLFIVESLYSFPGFGRGYWLAILELDYPMIMGLTLVYATVLLLVNLLIDVLSEILDPRIRVINETGAP